ncbi:MAG TPA: extracellular solute-binding protein [Acidimicrobiales bacterium]|jgi:sulfate transport system substrate-binding protein|nr:extracellular solute-binding protein [Acidimicrobiales bacterium]
MHRRLKALVITPFVATMCVAGLATASGASGGTVNVVGYSTISAGYTALETAFQATPAGSGVTFTNSFGASGTQAQDVVAGQPADVVNFSLIPDMNTVVNAGLVPRKWQTNKISAAEDGFVADSTVVIVVRKGNPLNITGWGNLTDSGVQIVTPDPISSGSAKWNLLAAYYYEILLGKRTQVAHTFLNKVVGNTVAEPSSGSKALSTFLAGTGNVLLAYESDAQEALAKGAPIQIVYPQQNILIQTPAALTNSGTSNPAAVAFFKYLFSPAGQAILVAQDYRSTLPSKKSSLNKVFYNPTKLVTIASMGGWSKVWSQFFGTTGLFTRIENAHGFTS